MVNRRVIQSRLQMAWKQRVNMNIAGFEGQSALVSFQPFQGPVEG